MIKYNVKKDFPEKGVVFIDFMPTFTNHELMNKIAKKIATEIKDAECIIMPESRGFLLGTLVASKLGINSIPIRKHGKIPEDFVGATEEYDTEYSKAKIDIPIVDIKGKKCYFIDDVYATGGTYRACKKLVETMGGDMVGGYCLYNVGIDDNNEIKCLLTINDIKGD